MSQGVRTDIESDAWHGWWNACPEAGISCDSDTCRRRCAPPPADAPHTAAPRLAERPDMYEEELRAACGELRSCEARVRVPVMATLRNRALRGLSEYMGMHPGDNVRVLFLHDTFFTVRRGANSLPRLRGARVVSLVTVWPGCLLVVTDVRRQHVWRCVHAPQAEQVVELLLTHGMSYDVACAMDFEGTRLHDVWAARDQAVRTVCACPPPPCAAVTPPTKTLYSVTRALQGEAFDAHYPFVAEPAAQAALRANEPFRVYSCWNGAVVLPGNALVEVRGHAVLRRGHRCSPHVRLARRVCTSMGSRSERGARGSPCLPTLRPLAWAAPSVTSARRPRASCC